jgi:hypothetical protein
MHFCLIAALVGCRCRTRTCIVVLASVHLASATVAGWSCDADGFAAGTVVVRAGPTAAPVRWHGGWVSC